MKNKFTNIEGTYVYYKNIDGNTMYFDIEANKIFYTITKNETYETYAYFFNKDQVKYKSIVNGKIKMQFMYLKSEKYLNCYEGNCDEYLKIYDDAVTTFKRVYATLSKS